MNSSETHKIMHDELPQILFKAMSSECYDEITDLNQAVDEKCIREAGERIKSFSSICIDNMVGYFIKTGNEHILATAEIDKKYYPDWDPSLVRRMSTPMKLADE